MDTVLILLCAFFVINIIMFMVMLYNFNNLSAVVDQLQVNYTSIMSDDTLNVKNIKVTGSASVNKLDVGDSASVNKLDVGDSASVNKLDVGDSASVNKLDVGDSASIPTLSTFIIKSNNKDNWIDCKGQLVCYEKLYTKKDMDSSGNIYTKGLEVNGTPTGEPDLESYDGKESYVVRFGSAGCTRRQGDIDGDSVNDVINVKRSCYRENGDSKLRVW